MSDVSIFDQHATRYAKAWDAFNRLYVMERPQPTAPRWYESLPLMMIPFGIIAVAGIALSALRTAPVFQQIAVQLVGETLSVVEAALAVIVVEVFIVVVRYDMGMQAAEDGTNNAESLKRWMQTGFWLAFAVAIIANVYASVKHVELIVPFVPILDLIMALAVGFCAPVLAFIAGDILASLYLRSEKRRQRMKDEYNALLQAWQDKRDDVWRVRKSDYGLRLKVDSLPTETASNSIPEVSNGISIGKQALETLPSASTLGHRKEPKASEKVRDYLKGNPDAVNMEPLELAALLGVGKSTVYAILPEFRNAQQPVEAVHALPVSVVSSNGKHSEVSHE